MLLLLERAQTVDPLTPMKRSYPLVPQTWPTLLSKIPAIYRCLHFGRPHPASIRHAATRLCTACPLALGWCTVRICDMGGWIRLPTAMSKDDSPTRTALVHATLHTLIVVLSKKSCLLYTRSLSSLQRRTLSTTAKQLRNSMTVVLKRHVCRQLRIDPERSQYVKVFMKSYSRS